MPLEIYNTLSRKKEEFTPLSPGRVGMYVCGPTVYSDTHIGHAKSYVSFDIVRRYLKFLGYHVTYVQNITDVGHLTDDADEGEDKLIKKSAQVKQHPMQIAETYTRLFFEDMKALNILPPDIAPRATGHIIEQIEMIKTLIEKGYAYEVNGSVYFDVPKDKDYGKLSGRKTEEQEGQGRVEARSEKRHPNDFALWKKAEKGHILRWPSPWGNGFPGWHIECSAMSMKYLGETIDIHGGGIENQFPHHECEIAQSECATGHKPFVRYWMHHNMVTVGGQKMGKSLGNASNLKELFSEFDPLAIRFFLLQSHYRSTTEFSLEAIRAAGVGYEKLLSSYKNISQWAEKIGLQKTEKMDSKAEIIQSFSEAMNDDFNTAKAIAILYDVAKETNTATDDQKLKELYQIWNVLAGDILGILPTSDAGLRTLDFEKERKALDALINKEIERRNAARANKDFAASDAIRKELSEAGILLEDTKDGTKWSIAE